MFWETSMNDGVVHAVFDNPPLNYYTDAAVTELATLVECWRHPSVRVVILSGRGDTFITHFSPDEILESIRNDGRSRSLGPVRNDAVNRVLGALAELRAPTIAALNGDAMGFGLELALACDVRIGQRGNLRYGFPEVALGVVPGSGGTQRLSRLCGLGIALELVVSARLLSPDEALRLGVVSTVADDAVGAARDLASRIVRLPALPVALAKRALYAGADASLASALAIESDANVRSKLGPGAADNLIDYLSREPSERRDWLDAGGGADREQLRADPSGSD